MDTKEINLVEDEEESDLQSKEKNTPIFKNKKFIIIICTLLILTIIGILLFYILKKNYEEKNGDEEEENFPLGEYIGIINCTYIIDKEGQNTLLIGNEFQKNFDMDIIIDGIRTKFIKVHNFNSIGEHNVQFRVYNNFSMDYMFKDVYNLISVKMYSDKNCEIYSMVSSFENCENLKNIENNGFDTSLVISMKKMFYNTGISEFDFNKINISTNNVEDISYMFGGIKSEKISISN